MPHKTPEEMDELLNKYKQRLGEELNIPLTSGKASISREYKHFKKEYLPKKLSFYEKACNASGKILKISPDEKKQY